MGRGTALPEKRETKLDNTEDFAKTKAVTAALDEAQNLPGKKIQNQPAASGKKAGDSVAD